MAAKSTRRSGVTLSPIRWVAIIAAGALAVHLAALWASTGAFPDSYQIGEVIGTHLAAFLLTALIASLTRVGSLGAVIAVYLLGFGLLQLLLTLTERG
jgi:hypothetical protein